MIAKANSAMESLEAALGRGELYDFSTFVAGRMLRDAELAELIEVDARACLKQGKPVRLDRYLIAVPDLPEMPISLDAAIEFSLRSLAGSSRPDPGHVESLVAAHPELETSIRNAAALSEGIASTHTLRRLDRLTPQRELPCDFGPTLPRGPARYELVRRLGGGAQGEVYLAVDRAMSEPDQPAMVALKILADRGWSESDRWQSIDEATRARRVTHDNVVRVHDRGTTDDGEEYIVYEHIDGGDLEGWLRSRQRSAREIARMVARIARGVQAAHAAGLVHRDLKPANILITRDGAPKVADFGVAHAQVTGQGFGGRIGNLAFIAPEHYRAGEAACSSATDVYGLGGILYYGLTGRLPHGETHDEVHARLAGDAVVAPPSLEAKAPGVDRDLEAICRRALAGEPSHRYPTADALAADLEAWLWHEPIGWLRPSPVRRLRLLMRRSPRQAALVAAATVAFAGLLAGTGAVWLKAQMMLEQSRHELAAARDAAERSAHERRKWQERFRSLQGTLANNFELEPSDWMPLMTILESLMGPYFFDGPGVDGGVWADRVPAAAKIIEAEAKRGHGDGLVALLFRDLQAYWLLKAGDHSAAREILAAADSAWEPRLTPDDPWRTVRAALHAAAVVKHHASRPVREAAGDDGLIGPPAPPLASADLAAAADQLRAAEAYFSRTHHGCALHRFIAETLAEAYGPTLLNRPGQWERYDTRARTLNEEARGERMDTRMEQRGLGPRRLWE